MKITKTVRQFVATHIKNLGFPSIIIGVLEKMLDSDFVCPCQPVYNELICFTYAAAPFFAFSVFTFFFMDCKQQDEVKSKCYQILYSILIGFIWLFFFFTDGRYVSCACSHWGGEYMENGALKWCRPQGGNVSEDFLRQKDTQRCLTISEFTGLGILAGMAITVGIMYCCKIRWCHDHCHGRCHCCGNCPEKCCEGWCDYCGNPNPDSAQRDVSQRNLNVGLEMQIQ